MDSKRIPLKLEENEVMEMYFTSHAEAWDEADKNQNAVKRVIDKIELLAEGGSSLVYLIRLQNENMDMQWILKEFYPASEEYLIKRDGRKLVVNEENQGYQQLKESFRRGYERLREMASYKDAAEYTTGTVPEGFAECNNTMYLLLPYKYTTSFKMDSVPIADVYDVLIRATECLDIYHQCGYLYLDLKPENILYHKPQKYIELFDCDTVLQKEELGKIGYQLRSTPAYCAPEVITAQQNGFTTTECIDEKSDYYTVGAMLYHAIFKKPFVRTPDFRDTVEAWSDIINKEESLERCSFEYKQRLAGFLYRTLHWRRRKRYESADKMKADLERLKTLSKQTIHFKDANLAEDVVFIGREEQLEDIAEHLEKAEKQHTGNSVVVCGQGGMGKSALARRYALLHRRNYLIENDRGYDTILVSDYEGCKGIAEFVSAVYDRTVCTDSSDRMDFVGLTDMKPDYEQKKQILTTLCKRSRVLLIVDNFNSREADKDINKGVMREIGWDVIYTSRCKLEAFGACIPLSDLGEEKIIIMFREYFRVACENPHREFTQEENADITLLLGKIDRHTMLAELFAKSAGAEEKVDGSTDIKALYEQFVKPYEEQEIGYTKDDNYSYGKINEIIGALYDKLPDSEVPQKILFHAALLSVPFTRDDLMELNVITREQKGSVEYLYKSGWLRINDSDYYDDKVHYELHPVMEEVLYARFKDEYCEDNCGTLIEGMIERLNRAFNCEDVVIREPKKKDTQIIKFLEKACEIGSLRVERKSQLLYLCGSWNGICGNGEDAREYLERKRELLRDYERLSAEENACIDADIKWYRENYYKQETWDIILKTAVKGYTRAILYMALYYKTIGDKQSQIRCYESAAENNSPVALYKLGKDIAYLKKYEEMAPKKEFDCFKRAAIEGLLDAYLEVGDCYRLGYGTLKDKIEAFKWYEFGAKEGHAGCQCELGSCYRHGIGTKIDDVSCLKWYQLSANQGYGRAYGYLGDYYEFLDEVEMFKWYMKGGELEDNVGVWYRLGDCYFNQKGVKKNIEQAMYWWTKVLKAGFPVTFCAEIDTKLKVCQVILTEQGPQIVEFKKVE